jgi:hypothetical protein
VDLLLVVVGGGQQCVVVGGGGGHRGQILWKKKFEGGKRDKNVTGQGPARAGHG